MSTAARARGGKFEADVMRYLRGHGYDVERLRLAGKEDEGDIVVKDGSITILELKATRRLDTASGVREAITEKTNYANHRTLNANNITGAMVWKVPGKPIGQALVILELREFFDIDEEPS